MSRRRQPPLFEFLGAPDRRSGGAAEGNAMGRRPVELPPLPKPVQVQPPRPGESTPAGKARAAEKRTEQDFHIPAPVLWLAAVAGVIAVAAVLYSVAFKLGQKDKENQLAPHLSEESPRTPGSPGQTLPPSDPAAPRPPDAGTGIGAVPPELAQPPVVVPTSTRDDPRQIGSNYLQLCTLTLKDATAASEYLAKNGVRALLVPVKKGIDPASAKDKNALVRVFVADGVASERFKATEREREELVAKVERIGKKWQREERGPSDFSRPGWVKYSGKD